MSVSYPDDKPSYDSAGIDALEQRLLGLGPMPRRGEENWGAAHWAQYAEIVRALVDRLACPAMAESGVASGA